MVENTVDRALIEAIQGGLPLVARPYAAIGQRIGLTESETIRRIAALIQEGTIKRFGIVVRHHELGYRANAMVVWDVPDHEVSALGRCLSRFDCVTLCYRRPRRPPHWPYNLFCMIHGRDRQTVLAHVAHIVETCGLEGVRHEVLFSRRRFKQRGAFYQLPNRAPQAGARREFAERSLACSGP